MLFRSVVFMFKKFAMNRYFLLGKLFNQAFRGADSNTRSIARSQMLGILGTSFAMAGVAGMPLVGAGQFLANLIMSDEDHPYDSEEEMKNAMGDLAYKGPINHMLNLDVSDRVGWNNMLWKDDPRRLAEVGAFDYFMERSIGVPYTMYSQGAEAFKHFKAGEYEKTAEAVAPAFVKNGLRMFDLATQGAVNSRGEKLADAEGGFNLLSQGLGFAPADVAEARARATAMSVEQKAIVNRRQALFDQLYAAKMAGSDEDYYKLMEDVEKFNNRNPDYPITGLQIIRSIQGREKQSRDAVMGVHLNRKLRDSLMEEYANPETL